MIPASLAAPPIAEDPCVQADWLECLVIASDGSANFAALGRAWDKRRADEESDYEGDGAPADADAYLEPVVSEINQRVELLGDAYPFKLSDNGSSMTMVGDVGALSVGAIIYLFCLLLSIAKADEVLEQDVIDVDDDARRLFQACATLAAAGDINGNAINFGFPRSDGSGFITALRRVYHAMTEGQVVAEPRPGTSTNPKDEGIDVIAWRSRRDGPGTYYLLGQVASGKNWKGKSVTEYIDPLHKLWFNESPASEPIRAMFIPHCIKRSRGATLAQQLHTLTIQFGIVYYRYRLPIYAAEGFALAGVEDKGLQIEGRDKFPDVTKWVNNTIQKLRT
jgi:hypothetical protein